MKTTRKEFKNLVQLHIRELMNSGQVGNYDNANTTKDQLQNVINEFYYAPNGAHRNQSKQEVFIDFLTGLPTCLSPEYTSYDIHETLKSWFIQCDSDYKYTEPNVKEEKTYYALLYREFKTLCEKYEVKF